MKINFDDQETTGVQIALLDNSRIVGLNDTNRLEFYNSDGKPGRTLDLTNDHEVRIKVEENWLTLRCMDGNDELFASYLVPSNEIKRVEVGNLARPIPH